MIDMAKTVACVLVNSRLDYANSVLYCASAANIAKLQHVQNALVRVVTYKKRADHICPVLKTSIDYKVASLVCRVQSAGSRAHLQAVAR